MTSTEQELTIGVTINLDNFENLRLEVSGKAETQEQADALAKFLDDQLARLGRGDAPTATRVDNYRKRVFGPAPAAKAPVTRPAQPAVQQQPASKPIDTGLDKQMPYAPTTPEKPAEPVKKAPEPAAKPAPVADGGTCEKCGGAVTKQQAKISQLFNGKALCKKCMGGQ